MSVAFDFELIYFLNEPRKLPLKAAKPLVNLPYTTLICEVVKHYSYFQIKVRIN